MGPEGGSILTPFGGLGPSKDNKRAPDCCLWPAKWKHSSTLQHQGSCPEFARILSLGLPSCTCGARSVGRSHRSREVLLAAVQAATGRDAFACRESKEKRWLSWRPFAIPPPPFNHLLASLVAADFREKQLVKGGGSCSQEGKRAGVFAPPRRCPPKAEGSRSERIPFSPWKEEAGTHFPSRRCRCRRSCPGAPSPKPAGAARAHQSPSARSPAPPARSPARSPPGSRSPALLWGGEKQQVSGRSVRPGPPSSPLWEDAGGLGVAPSLCQLSGASLQEGQRSVRQRP